MRTYSNPTTQALVNEIYAISSAAQDIIVNMQATLHQQRRQSDKVTVITAEQAARIQANQGKVIYGPSHPKYISV